MSDIHVNDVDPSIWAFWHSVLNHNEEFSRMILETPVNIEEWYRQRAIHLEQKDDDPVALGFSAFFLNRTNRSGIISGAGVIGGYDQKGPYKMDCRFNKEDLCRRVRRVSKYRSRIHLTRQDALEFLSDAKEYLPQQSFFFIDPPYFVKGSNLYTSFYDHEDHVILASKILAISNPWILTYDNAPAISRLYPRLRQFEFDIGYSLARKRKATELLIASKGLRIPGEARERLVRRRMLRAA